jgi:hypothetical protein
VSSNDVQGGLIGRVIPGELELALHYSGGRASALTGIRIDHPDVHRNREPRAMTVRRRRDLMRHEMHQM